MRPPLKAARLPIRQEGPPEPKLRDPDTAARLRWTELEDEARAIARIAVRRSARSGLGDADVAAHVCRRAATHCSWIIHERTTTARQRRRIACTM